MEIDKKSLAFCISLSGAAAMANLYVLHAVNGYIETRGDVEHAIIFVLLGLCAYSITLFAASLILAREGCRMSNELRAKFLNATLSARIKSAARVGRARMAISISEDIDNITQGVSVLPLLIYNSMAFTCISFYVVFTYRTKSIFIFAAIAVGGLVTWAIAKVGDRYYRSYRAALIEYRRISDIAVDGKRELFSSTEIYKVFSKVWSEKSLKRLHDADIGREYVWNISETWSRVFAIAATCLVLIAFSAGKTNSFGYSSVVIAMTMLISPTEYITNAFPFVSRARECMQSFRATLSALEVGPMDFITLDQMEILRLESVTLDRASDGSAFKLGPISYSFNRGQVYFLYGGNGSGKSTLLSLLAGYEEPTMGTIFADAVPINGKACDRIRVLNTDFHLIPFIRPDNLFIDPKTLGLPTNIESDGSLNGHVNLSHGQNKRLGLVQTTSIGADFFIFDEFAADQDPEYKKRFYREILPRLKDAGAGVIVITHDEHYKDHADHVLVMRDGVIIDSYAARVDLLKNAEV